MAVPVCTAGSNCNLPDFIKTPWTRGQETVRLDLNASTTWKVNFVAGECWAEEIVVEPGRTPAPISASVWPAATIQASLSAEKGLQLPQTALLAIDDGVFRPSTTCTIDARRLTCRAPAMTGDVRLEVPGYAPVYHWSRTLRPDTVTSLGDVVLKRAASLSGRVAVARRGKTAAGASISIKPAFFPQTREDLQRVSALSRTAKASATGLFHVTALEPGRYEVRATKDGWSPSEAVFIEVDAGKEAVLPRDLRLEPLIAFEVLITPPLAPDAQPWIVRLKEASWDHPKSFEMPAGLDGRWSKEGVEAGKYTLTVFDRAGSTFLNRGITVDAASSLLVVTIDGVAVRGRIALGDKPLRASVKFSKQKGSERATFQSGDEGTFTGVLPSEGAWDVEVTPHAHRHAIRAPAIDVRRSHDGVAEVAITLENGRISGRVVDAGGRGKPAVVHVTEGLKAVTHARTADDGTFELVGIPAGRMNVRATAGDSDSGVISHRVREDDDEPVTLVLRPKRRVRGWVVTPAGRPVSGATIRYQTQSISRMNESISGPDGEFELSVSPGETLVTAVIVAPPMALKMLQLPVDDEPKEVVLERAAGILLIKARIDAGIFIRRGPVTASLYTLSAPRPPYMRPPESTPRGRAYALEPGEYLVCRSYFAPAESCQPVSLAAGAEQTVTVDNSDELPDYAR